MKNICAFFLFLCTLIPGTAVGMGLFSLVPVETNSLIVQAIHHKNSSLLESLYTYHALKQTCCYFNLFLTNDKVKKLTSTTPATLNGYLFSKPLQYINIVPYLLTLGADINTQDVQGYTLLHNAVFAKQQSWAQFLLEHNADAAIPNNYKRTPVHSAIECKNSPILDLLLTTSSAQNSINNASTLGFTPLQEAVKAHDVYVKINNHTKAYTQTTIIAKLIKAGAHIHETNHTSSFDMATKYLSLDKDIDDYSDAELLEKTEHSLEEKYGKSSELVSLFMNAYTNGGTYKKQ